MFVVLFNTYHSYMKNVTIYAVANFIRIIIEQIFSGQKISLILYAIMSFIVALIDVKVMEFAKKNTNSILTFMLLSVVVMALIEFVALFILTFMISDMFANMIM